jgi:hypothetical protein
VRRSYWYGLLFVASCLCVSWFWFRPRAGLGNLWMKIGCRLPVIGSQPRKAGATSGLEDWRIFRLTNTVAVRMISIQHTLIESQ